MSVYEHSLSQSTISIHLRMCMYALTILIHVVNVGLTHMWCYKITDDPELKFFYPFWPRLFTVWVIGMHIVHAAIGLICDKHALDKIKHEDKAAKDKRLEYIERVNSTFFCSLVWPGTWVCSAIFWFFYHYNKNLLREAMMKKLSNPITNHIAHTFILAAVLWEAILRPRQKPKSDKRHIVYGLSMVLLYIVVLSYTYITSGTWIYPFYDDSYGTIYFPLLHVATCLLTVIFYYAQWPVSRCSTLLRGDTFEKLLLNRSIQKRLQ